MKTATAVAPAQQSEVVVMQGTQVPSTAINPTAFFDNTRRQQLLMKQVASWGGFGNTDTLSVLQTGIISALELRVTGTLTVAGTGTTTSSYAWPYNILRSLRFTANGQSNLINVCGLTLKAFSITNRLPSDDRGVSQKIGGNTVTQGTLSLASESWGGFGPGQTVAAGSYDVELLFEIPVAYDQVSLTGAIFAQTQSTALTIEAQWENASNVFTNTGNNTVTFTPGLQLEGTVYTIPAVSGGMAIPDLRVFHSLVEANSGNAVSNGNNEIILTGQGVGRKLMRLGFQVMSNNIPLAMTMTNFTTLYWRYGGNTTPETFADGTKFRQWNERLYNTDIGGQWGYGVFDWSSLYAKRDAIDEGKITELRYGFTIPTGVTLTSPSVKQTQQTLVAGATAA